MTDRYVHQTDGDDANAGTLALPWKTAAKVRTELLADETDVVAGIGAAKLAAASPCLRIGDSLAVMAIALATFDARGKAHLNAVKSLGALIPHARTVGKTQQPRFRNPMRMD